MSFSHHVKKLQPQQKEVVKPADQFEKTDRVLLGGRSKPVVARKKTKTGAFKDFVLKRFEREEGCNREKLYYDLLQLCGVCVPKSYILANEKNKYTILATRMEPGYKDLLHFVGGKIVDDEWIELSPDVQNESFSRQCIGNKPIIGLYENVAVFTFLEDRDAVGCTYQNVGLIEHEEHFQAVKIDPGCCYFYKSNDKNNYGNKQYIKALTTEKFEAYWGDCGGNFDVFKHATREQINDGMQRVADLSNEQLHSVVYNEKIPSLSKETRDEIYELLIFRRNSYKDCLARFKDGKFQKALTLKAYSDIIDTYQTKSRLFSGIRSKEMNNLVALKARVTASESKVVTEDDIKRSLISVHRKGLFSGHELPENKSTDEVINKLGCAFRQNTSESQ